MSHVPAQPIVEDERVTVVVATRNRRDELLSALAHHRARVIVVTNGATDGTADAVRGTYPSVEVVELANNEGARARTIGVQRANTPYVAFADDDSWWAPGSLARGAELLSAHPRVGLLHARMLVGPEERLDPLCAELARSPLPRPPGSPGPAILGFAACAAMVRTDAFLAAGGFDDVVRFPGEEERLSLDLAELGWQQAYTEELVVHHHPSPSRHGPDARRRAVTRSAILTAALRLPAGTVAQRVWRALTGDAATRGGALDALRELPRALGRRRPVSDDVLDQLAVLHEHEKSATASIG
ncbi:glycosyltransferase family 2 protein [Ornithinicoccus halotolerans]|uniref:glycosyltransferase family 2 protein n=1 Tax=Ornithinicoccus halotolerans TaxID=1748220 RepID=UPI001E3427E4|nr:glycosyltransferase [Ornithinicoccus halotolerans]